MATTVTRQWPDSSGDSLSVAFSGGGDGTISVSSDPCEGLDRSMVLSVSAKGCDTVSLTVSQTGRREEFGGSDTSIILSEGGTFNVLKQF
jgi:hypothetical protein